MPRKSRILLHLGVLPKMNLVMGVPVSRYKLIHILRKYQVTDLRACLNTVRHFERQGVPEPNRPVRRPSPGGQSPMLMRTPSDRLHSCSMG